MATKRDYIAAGSKDLSVLAARVKNAATLEDKKAEAYNFIESMQYQTKAPLLKQKVDGCYNGTQVESLIYMILLSGEGMGKI